MEIFSRLLSISKDDKKAYVDVTKSVLDSASFDGIDEVFIKTDSIPVDINMSSSKVHCAVFAKKSDESSCVHVNQKLNRKKLVIEISADKDNLKAYFDLKLPIVEHLVVDSTDGDITLKNIKAENIEIVSSSGDVLLHCASFDRCAVDTSASDIHFVLCKGDYDIKAKTKEGDVTKVKVKRVPSSDKKIVCKSDCGDILFEYED